MAGESPSRYNMGALNLLQIPTDFGTLRHKCLPSNLDGITERCGRFLVLEVKQANEWVSIGQERMLRALAALPQFDVMVVRCKTVNPDERGARPFFPIAYRFIEEDTATHTTLERFVRMYSRWCSNPLLGKANFAEVV
jgi:hypothetical protein